MEELVVEVLPVDTSMLVVQEYFTADTGTKDPREELIDGLKWLEVLARSGALIGRPGKFSICRDGVVECQWDIVEKDHTFHTSHDDWFWPHYGWIHQ